MRLRVGIDSLGIAVPRRYVDIEDLATARGVPPAKYTSGLGAREMAIAEPGEDTVSLAAAAARRALDAARIERSLSSWHRRSGWFSSLASLANA